MANIGNRPCFYMCFINWVILSFCTAIIFKKFCKFSLKMALIFRLYFIPDGCFCLPLVSKYNPVLFWHQQFSEQVYFRVWCLHLSYGLLLGPFVFVTYIFVNNGSNSSMSEAECTHSGHAGPYSSTLFLIV